jgi:hypothetical protein
VLTPLLVALALSGAHPQKELPPPKLENWSVEYDVDPPARLLLRVRGMAVNKERQRARTGRNARV